jgi:hypothetical protein
LNDEAKLDPSNTMLPNRAGPIHMQHDTKLHPDRPYNPNTAYNSLPAWPAGGGGGGGGGWGFGLGGPPPRAPPPSEDDSDDDDDGFGALVPAAKNVTPEGMYRGRAEGGRDYFFSPSRLRWADSEEEFVPYIGPQPYDWERVQAAIDRADVEVATADVEGLIRRNERALASLDERASTLLATPMKLEGSPGSRNDSAIVPSRSRAGRIVEAVPRSRLVRSSTDNPSPTAPSAALAVIPDSAADGYATEDEVGYEVDEDDEVGVPIQVTDRSQSPLAPQPSPSLVYSPPPRGTPWPSITSPPSRSLGPMAPAFNPTLRPRSENPLAARYVPSPVRNFGSLVTNEVTKRLRSRRNSAVAISAMF